MKYSASLKWLWAVPSSPLTTSTATTTVMLRIADMAETTLPVFILRVVSPAVVSLLALSLIPLKQATPPAPDSAITSVVVATSVPRRAAILAFLSLAAVSYLADGLVFVIFSVITKQWPRHTAIPLNSLLGLASFSAIAVIGAWKDVAGANVWSLKRLKTGIFVSLSLDIALVALLGLDSHFRTERMSLASILLYFYSTLAVAPHIPENPGGLPLQTLLHLAFPALRVLLLLPLLVCLLSPRTVYTPVPSDDDEVRIAQPTASSFLLPPEAGTQNSSLLSGLNAEGNKYGTFRTTHSNLQSAPQTRSTTPVPSTSQGVRVFGSSD